MSSTEELLKRLGVFIDAETLRLALTHRSYAYENGGIPTNERLEFLGDSILGFSVTDALYRDNPSLPEGDLAKRRSAVVDRKSTRLNSSHGYISYAVFCLKKKKKKIQITK